MYSKVSMRYNFTPGKMTKMKNIHGASAGKDEEELEHVAGGIIKCTTSLAVYNQVKHTLTVSFSLSTPRFVFMRNE